MVCPFLFVFYLWILFVSFVGANSVFTPFVGDGVLDVPLVSGFFNKLGRTVFACESIEKYQSNGRPQVAPTYAVCMYLRFAKACFDKVENFVL